MTFEIKTIEESDSMIEGNIIKGQEEPIEPDFETIGEALFDALTNYPNHISQIDSETGATVTFGEIKDKSVRCALWLKKQGITEDDIVVMCTHNHLDTVIPILSTFFVEAVCSAWDHEITEHLARQLMRIYKPRFMFVCESAVDVLSKASKLENINVTFVVFGEHSHFQSLKEITQQQSTLEVKRFTPRNKKDPQKMAVIILTSGSSGLPKGVMHSGYLMSRNLNTPMNCNKTFMSYSTLLWVSGFCSAIWNISSRLTNLINPIFEAENFCRTVEKYKVQTVFLTSTMLARLAKYDGIEGFNLQSLREIFTGGAKVASNIIENLQKRIPNAEITSFYGMTELMSIAMTSEKKDCKNSDSVGNATANVQMKIIDQASGEALGPNKLGELCIKKPIMMMGYYKNPSATAEALDAEGWLHTGDLCHYSEDGEIFLKDRLKELMQYQNIRITPTEIEEVLMSHPAVMEVAVAPVPHELDGERPMAFVKITPGQKVTEEEIIELSSILGEKKKLHGGVKFLDDLPKTGTGKIARTELKQIARSLGHANVAW